jgi:hypothetical protein
VLFYFKYKGDNMKFNLLFIAIFLSVIIYANINESNGIIGLTLRDGGDGCICHNLETSEIVHVWIGGPDTVIISDTVDYKVFMTGGPAVEGGFNVAVNYGVLDSSDTLTQTLPFYAGGEQLTHTIPKAFVNDTVVWDFKYTAPDMIVVDTIYSVANSVNGDGNPVPGDEWNFGMNFPVVVVDIPVTVKDNISPIQFSLKQNYPNPFNPSTIIQYSVNTAQFISLKVYDLLGKEISTLVNEEKPIGIYEVDFNAENLPSGIYFYRLQVYPANSGTGEFVEIKKMVLLR